MPAPKAVTVTVSGPAKSGKTKVLKRITTVLSATHTVKQSGPNQITLVEKPFEDNESYYK